MASFASRNYVTILDTQTLGVPPRFPCKANCLCECRCDDHLCRDWTCRAPPNHGHPTAPCDEAGVAPEDFQEPRQWKSIDTDDLKAEYDVEYGSILNAITACVNDFCPSQARRWFSMLDEAYDYGRMIVWYPECLDWSVDDVVNFIKSLGFPHFYENCFRKNDINGNKLYLCNSNRLVEMGIKDWKDVRIITKAIRDLFKIGYPKEEVPLKKPRTSVQSLYEFWLRKRAFYALANEKKAQSYCFRKFLDEYGIDSPEEDNMKIFKIASGHFMERLFAGGRRRREIRIRELRSAAYPQWIENKNRVFLTDQEEANVPKPGSDDDAGNERRSSIGGDDQEEEEAPSKLVHFTVEPNEERSVGGDEDDQTVGGDDGQSVEDQEVGQEGEKRNEDVESGSEEVGQVNQEESDVVVVAADQNANREINALEDGIDDDAPPNVNIFAPELE